MFYISKRKNYRKLDAQPIVYCYVAYISEEYFVEMFFEIPNLFNRMEINIGSLSRLKVFSRYFRFKINFINVQKPNLHATGDYFQYPPKIIMGGGEKKKSETSSGARKSAINSVHTQDHLTFSHSLAFATST